MWRSSQKRNTVFRYVLMHLSNYGVLISHDFVLLCCCQMIDWLDNWMIVQVYKCWSGVCIVCVQTHFFFFFFIGVTGKSACCSSAAISGHARGSEARGKAGYALHFPGRGQSPEEHPDATRRAQSSPNNYSAHFPSPDEFNWHTRTITAPGPGFHHGMRSYTGCKEQTLFVWEMYLTCYKYIMNVCFFFLS